MGFIMNKTKFLEALFFATKLDQNWPIFKPILHQYQNFQIIAGCIPITQIRSQARARLPKFSPPPKKKKKFT